jgi:hypothetical protein
MFTYSINMVDFTTNIITITIPMVNHKTHHQINKKIFKDVFFKTNINLMNNKTIIIKMNMEEGLLKIILIKIINKNKYKLSQTHI